MASESTEELFTRGRKGSMRGVGSPTECGLTGRSSTSPASSLLLGLQQRSLDVDPTRECSRARALRLAQPPLGLMGRGAKHHWGARIFSRYLSDIFSLLSFFCRAPRQRKPARGEISRTWNAPNLRAERATIFNALHTHLLIYIYISMSYNDRGHSNAFQQLPYSTVSDNFQHFRSNHSHFSPIDHSVSSIRKPHFYILQTSPSIAACSQVEKPSKKFNQRSYFLTFRSSGLTVPSNVQNGQYHRLACTATYRYIIPFGIPTGPETVSYLPRPPRTNHLSATRFSCMNIHSPRFINQK